MLSYFLMACLLCVVCTVFYYLARVADEKTRRRQEWEQAEYRNSDAYFYKAQTWLESQLQHADLPNSVIGQQRYIYQTLMRGWFDHLAAENRYDVDRLKRFRGDWLEYLDALVEWRACNFLALEGSNESKRLQYDLEADIARRKARAIEDAFAAAAGERAAKQLNDTREMKLLRFSFNGVLAPEGKVFVGRRHHDRVVATPVMLTT